MESRFKICFWEVTSDYWVGFDSLQWNHYRELLQWMIDGAEIMLDGRYKQKDKKGTSSPNPLYYFYIGEQSVN